MYKFYYSLKTHLSARLGTSSNTLNLRLKGTKFRSNIYRWGKRQSSVKCISFYFLQQKLWCLYKMFAFYFFPECNSYLNKHLFIMIYSKCFCKLELEWTDLNAYYKQSGRFINLCLLNWFSVTKHMAKYPSLVRKLWPWDHICVFHGCIIHLVNHTTNIFWAVTSCMALVRYRDTVVGRKADMASVFVVLNSSGRDLNLANK